MRKSIFDIAAEKTDVVGDIQRIITMADDDFTLFSSCSEYTLFDFVDEGCFANWKHRGHFTSVDDYLSTVGLKKLQKMLSKMLMRYSH